MKEDNFSAANRPVTVLILALQADEAGLDHYLEYLSQRTISNDRILCTVGYQLPMTDFWSQMGWQLLSIEASDDRAWSATLFKCNSHERDLIVIRAGTLVPKEWDLRLAALLPTNVQNLALSPLGTKQPVFSAFLPQISTRKLKLDVDEVNDWLAVRSSGCLFDTPAISGSCCLFRGTVWSDSSISHTDSDWLAAALEQGAMLLGTDEIYCDDHEVDGSTINSPRYQKEVEGFESRHVLTGLRHALTDLASRGERPEMVPSPSPVQLHVTHSWGGGLGRWVEDFVSADQQRHNLVLRSIGVIGVSAQRLSLYRGASMDVPIQSWVLATPILSTVIRHYEYQNVLSEIIREFGIEAIIVSSFIGHSLDILRTGLPTVVSVHDFYPYCPALVATFGQPCHVCDEARLKQCHTENSENRFFDSVDSEYQQVVRRQYVADIHKARAHLIFPTHQTRAQLIGLAPDLAQCPFSVIGHGLGKGLNRSLSNLRQQPILINPENERLRIVALGSLNSHKGRSLFEKVVDNLESITDIFLLGCGDDGKPYNNRPHVTVIPRYEREMLAAKLQEIQPDLGLLMSTVPETFSYTLSELQAAGIPTLATQLGAFAERITHEVDGFLVKPEAKALCMMIDSLSKNRALLAQVKRNLRQQPLTDASDMVAAYEALLPLPAINISRWRCRKARMDFDINDHHQQVGPVLYIDTQATFRTVLVEFIEYTAGKLGGTNRLPRWLRRPSNKGLRWLARLLQ